MSVPPTNTERALFPERSTHFLWAEFDQLPRVLRDLINFAPINVGTGFVYAQLKAGSPVEAVARAAFSRWRRYTRELALRHYGPTHPQVEVHDA